MALIGSKFILDDDFKIYPNPTTGHVFIQNAYDWRGARYLIYDHQGAQQSEGPIESDRIEMPEGLPDGIYIIHLVDNNGTRYSERVVLSR